MKYSTLKASLYKSVVIVAIYTVALPVGIIEVIYNETRIAIHNMYLVSDFKRVYQLCNQVAAEIRSAQYNDKPGNWTLNDWNS